jgi:hypothetical protein
MEAYDDNQDGKIDIRGELENTRRLHFSGYSIYLY